MVYLLLISIVLLSSLFSDPPNPPRLGGDLVSEKRAGDKVRLECISNGGNPLPQLYWIKNGEKIKSGKTAK